MCADPDVLVAAAHFVFVVGCENITLLNDDTREYSILNIVFGYSARLETYKVTEVVPEMEFGHYASKIAIRRWSRVFLWLF